MDESELTNMGNTPWRRRKQKPAEELSARDVVEQVTSGRMPEAPTAAGGEGEEDERREKDPPTQ